ncbi:MAG: NAD(P)-dependent dehydrogenase, partial [Brachybacterium tyrofermentans]
MSQSSSTESPRDPESTLSPVVARRARDLATVDGRPSFAEQDQQPPGLTAPMDPVPDHGEHSYVGHGR